MYNKYNNNNENGDDNENYYKNSCILKTNSKVIIV